MPRRRLFASSDNGVWGIFCGRPGDLCELRELNVSSNRKLRKLPESMARGCRCLERLNVQELPDFRGDGLDAFASLRVVHLSDRVLGLASERVRNFLESEAIELHVV